MIKFHFCGNQCCWFEYSWKIVSWGRFDRRILPSPARFGSEIFGFAGFRHALAFFRSAREFLPQSVVCLRSGIKANSSVRKFPEKIGKFSASKYCFVGRELAWRLGAC